MKIRTGFVSNSSTTSYTCDLCAHTEAGYDSVGIEDFGFWSCENDHVVCFDCVPEEQMMDFLDEDEGYYMVGTGACPVCRFEVASNGNLARYLLKETGIDRDEAFAEVKKVNRRRKKLYDHEYVSYVARVKDIDVNKLLSDLREQFGGDYRAFLRSLR